MGEKILCLVWAPFSSRMDELSEQIEGRRHNITFLYGHKYLAPLRYIVLALKTAYLILKARPEIVYAQNPSVFCPLACLPYCVIWRKKLVIDHHAVWSVKTFRGGILGRTIRRLERFVASHAFLNTVPHSFWSNELVKLGAKNILIIYDYVEPKGAKIDEEIRRKFSSGREHLGLAPHGGHPLEKIESLVEAVHGIDSMTLLLSGPQSKLKTRLEKLELEPNVKYVGLLPKEEYEKLESSVDLGLSITDEPFTISHTLLEFASCSVPAISSNQPAVKELFRDSLFYVNSSKPSDIQQAIKAIFAVGNLELYRERIRAQCESIAALRRAQIYKLKVALGFGGVK